MAKLFRSEEMTYMETIVPAEAARSFAFQLAALGCVQLTDVWFFFFSSSSSIFILFRILLHHPTTTPYTV